MDAWKCPDGWRVKGDGEICEKGDCYSHDTSGYPVNCPDCLPVGRYLGKTVATALSSERGGGFILTQVPPQPPNDTCLAWLAGKVTAAMKEFPDDADVIRLDWLAGKAGLAKSMLGKIEDIRAKRLSLSSTVDQKVDCDTKD